MAVGRNMYTNINTFNRTSKKVNCAICFVRTSSTNHKSLIVIIGANAKSDGCDEAVLIWHLAKEYLK